MKNGHIVAKVAGVVLVALMAGCEWEWSGDEGSWSSMSGEVNFSGNYYATDGGPVVREFGIASTSTVTQTVTEQIGTGNNADFVFQATLSAPVVEGSITITDTKSETLTDSGGQLQGNNGGSGIVNYDTGYLSVTFGTYPAAGSPIMVTYQWLEPVGVSGAAPASSSPIYTFQVEQTGNKVSLTDNNGDRYSGDVGEATGFAGPMGGGTQAVTRAYAFTANGSSLGVGVNMVGNLQAVEVAYFMISASTGGTANASSAITEFMRVASLSMYGTWIEDSGARGQISAIGPQGQQIQIIAPGDYQYLSP